MSTMESQSPDLERHRVEEIVARSAHRGKVLKESRRERIDIEARLRSSRRALTQREGDSGPLGRLLAYFSSRRR